jgi:site-specific DNA-methyltransferase (adenine-specific)
MARPLREPIPRIDTSPELYQELKGCTRLTPGEVWEDPIAGHRVGVLDATDPSAVGDLMQGERALAAVQDPPYNFAVGGAGSPGLFAQSLQDYVEFTRGWVTNTLEHLQEHAHLYIWMGADQRRDFQPLADVVILLREFPELESRSWITVRNQRGYGTQHNWMAVRQELLYYRRGKPGFAVQHTAIPRLLRGYYKNVGGRRTETGERSHSDTIRPGNVWIDVQQVFYRSLENVPGAYAQKPLAAVERILAAAEPATRAPGVTPSAKGVSAGRGAPAATPEIVLDLFAHSGTTLLAAERRGLRCFTADVDPVFAEITIRRLEHYRRTGRRGWQCDHPFPELASSGGEASEEAGDASDDAGSATE